MAKLNSQKVCTEALKKIGWLVGRTESYSGFTGNSNDLHSFIDAIGTNNYRCVALQFCGSDFQEHIKKIEPLTVAHKWNAVNDCWLIGVKKVLVKKGGKQERYAFRVGYFKNPIDNPKRLVYTELCSWSDKRFDLEFLNEVEKDLFKTKTREVLETMKSP